MLDAVVGSSDVIGLIVADLVVSAAVAGTTKAAALGTLKPNSWAGIRTPATQACPQAWVAAHRAGWPWAAAIAGIGVVGAVVAGILLVTDRPDLARFVAWAPLFVTVAGSVPLVQVANRAARSA